MDPQSCHPSEGQGQIIKGKQKGVMVGEEEGKTRPQGWFGSQSGLAPSSPYRDLLARTSAGPDRVRDFRAAALKPAQGQWAGC